MECVISWILGGEGGSVVQRLAHDLKVASSIQAHCSFLVRGIVLSR